MARQGPGSEPPDAPNHLTTASRSAKYDRRVITPSRSLIGASVENFRTRNGSYERILTDRVGHHTASILAAYPGGDTRPTSAGEAERAWLQGRTPPPQGAGRQSVRTVDLFSGCGGLTIGLAEAARALNRPFEPTLAVDIDPVAVETFAANFPTADARCGDVADVLTGAVGTRLTPSERALARKAARIDVLVGGPPCQGHSDFNNRTRHRDHKNELYSTMVRAAEVLEPQHVLIENVPGALNDRRSVVQRTADALDDLGYRVAMGVLDLSELGVPQSRRRLVLMASLTHSVTPADVMEQHRRRPRDVAWAFQDLETMPDSRRTSLVDAVAQSAPATRRRIDYLFEHGLADLPDRQRPACHAGGGHSYKSIYGRLAWDRPSQTVTTGFYSMCMGRYVHPSRRRTITAHEAARLQYIPDWFSFEGVRQRTALARMIGNAVPSRLSYAVALEWLR